MLQVEQKPAIVLRDYQEECVRLVLDAYGRWHANPLQGERLQYIVLATGAGKTVCFSQFVHEVRKMYGYSALILAHRDELLEQAADKYRMIHPTAIIGKVGAGRSEYGGEVTVASIATVSRPKHLKELQRFNYGVVIVDEFHHFASNGYQKVFEALPDSFFLGVTATPMRLDGKKLSEQPPLYVRNILDLIKECYLCNVRAIAIRTHISLDEVRSLAGDFNEHELDLAVNTPARNLRVVKAYQQYASGKRAIVFGVTVAHATALCYTFQDMGVMAVVIAGDTPHEERQRIYRDFDAGLILVLCSVMVLTEGFDSPKAEVAILARPTQSQSLYIQMAGRVLRPAPGKECAIILDITDNVTSHKIAPKSFKKSILDDDIEMSEEETLLDALKRDEEDELSGAKEHRAMVRKLKKRREQDQEINLFGAAVLPAWEELENGLFRLTIGKEGHKVAVVPVKDHPGLYDVRARLAPDFKYQVWEQALDFDTAIERAERRARQVLEGESKPQFFDKNAPWRQKPIDPQSPQAAKLKQHRIAWGPGTGIETKGQAADAIDARKAEIEREKLRKAARKAQRERKAS